ncbi:SprB repeat-containing protein, partial [Flavobacteriales bacterium]|nr:SprB repeat-containing protein [Flavobacteriales bacterium]
GNYFNATGETLPAVIEWYLDDGDEILDSNTDLLVDINEIGVDMSIDINNLESLYHIVSTDSNGFETYWSHIVVQPPLLELSLVSAETWIYCNGDNTGNIDIQVTGGTPFGPDGPDGIPGTFDDGREYIYSWSTPDEDIPLGQNDDQDLSNLTAGTYTVIVTDANDCRLDEPLSLSVTIEEANPILSSELQSDYNGFGVSCIGDSNGSISITLSDSLVNPANPFDITYSLESSVLPSPINGVVPYDNNNGSVLAFPGLSAGVYTVTITMIVDQIGEQFISSCKYEQVFTITQPEPMESTYNSLNVNCNGGSDGAIYVSVIGGVAPYTYSWTASNGGVVTGQEINEDLINLVAGDYSLVITDANNCDYSIQDPDPTILSVTISEPDPVVVEVVLDNFATITHPLCNYGNVNSGEISIDINALNTEMIGGTAPWQVLYIENSSGEETPGIVTGDVIDFTELPEDTYIVWVQDAIGCTYSLIPSIILISENTDPCEGEGCYDASGNFYNIGEGIVFSECEGIECEGANNWVPYIIDDCETFCDTVFVEVPIIVTDTIVETEYVEVIITEYIDCDSGLPCTSGMGEIIDKSKTDGKIYNLLGQEIFRRDGIYIEGGEIKYRF